jgi:hypothetical protein
MSEITFVYHLTGTGWSEANISDGVTHAMLSASYLSDALGDLTRAVLSLLHGAEEDACSWLEEPGEYQWRFRRVGDELAIQILWFDDWYELVLDKTGRLHFTTRCSLFRFASQLEAALKQLLEEHGLEGYRQKWYEHEFPAAEHQKLTEWLRRGNEADRRQE